MATASSILELEEMLQRVSPAARGQTLRAVTDLFLQGVGRYRPEQIETLDDLLGWLMDETDAKERKALSKRLAPCANAPIKTLLRLARDQELSVAEPVILQSPCLDDTVLREIAQTMSQEHLMAIACRTKVSAEVTDVLIERGDDVVVRYVANNQGASFSQAGFLALVQRSKTDGALADQIKQRRDLRQHQLKVS